MRNRPVFLALLLLCAGLLGACAQTGQSSQSSPASATPATTNSYHGGY